MGLNQSNSNRNSPAKLHSHIEALQNRIADLDGSLSLARHNMLQTTMRYEEEVAKTKYVEDLRIADIKQIARLESQLLN
jgi:TolA-binding protein